MTTPNAQFMNVFKYENPVGTDAITVAGDQTYRFGLYPAKTKIDTVSMNVAIEAVESYASREPTSLAVAYWEHQTQVLPTYCPVNAQALHRICGTATSGTPNTITVLDIGIPKSFTWRQELYGGTNPHRRQMRGCFTTGLDIDIIAHQPMQFKETIQYWGLKDQGDYVALTQAPAFAESLDHPYMGIYAATHSVVGSLASWLARAQIKLEKEITEFAHSATEQRFYPTKFKPHSLTLWGIDDTTDLWDELNDSTITSDIVITTRSQNYATDGKYITFNLNNVAWTKNTASGLILEGNAIATSKGDMFVFQLVGRPQSIDMSFIDVPSNFNTHYPP
jgi:hypothetical protein